MIVQTLELGVRYDNHQVRVPDYPRMDGDSNPTGEIIEGRDMVDWTSVDPRLGWLGEAAVEVSPGIKMGAQVARAYADREEVAEADMRGLVRITVGHERVESQY